MRSCCLGSAGFANQEVALNARLGTLSLLAQLRSFLGKAFFEGGSLCETAPLWHTLLHPFEDWRERDRRSHHR
jgi:hypothetical protein